MVLKPYETGKCFSLPDASQWYHHLIILHLLSKRSHGMTNLLLGPIDPITFQETLLFPIPTLSLHIGQCLIHGKEQEKSSLDPRPG